MAAKYAYFKANGMQRTALIQIHHLRAILHWFQIKDDRDLVKGQLEDRTNHQNLQNSKAAILIQY